MLSLEEANRLPPSNAETPEADEKDDRKLIDTRVIPVPVSEEADFSADTRFMSVPLSQMLAQN